MTIKVSDLTDVKDRGLPLLYAASGSDVLHVVRREGYVVSNSNRGSKTTYMVTDCNRPIEWGTSFHEGVISGWHGRLCSRCGTPEQFQKALNDYHRLWKESNDAYKAREAAKQAELKRIWSLAAESAGDFSYDLEAQKDRLGLTDIVSDGYNITAVLTIDGRKHRVKIEVLAEGES